MQVCLLDVRCCQDAVRPHAVEVCAARAILGSAREGLPGTRLLGLVDPALPELPDDIRALLDGVKENGYTAGLEGLCCFVQLSPLTHDPLFVARLLLRPEIVTIACVHPMPSFGPKALARLDAHLSLRWLARHDLFLPVCATASLQLDRLLGVANGNRPLIGEIEGFGADAAAPESADMAVRFWREVRQFIARPPATARARAPRVALALAVSPARTDLANYGAALCAELGRDAALDVFTPTNGAVQPDGAVGVRPLSPVPFLSGRYDRVVAVIDDGPAAAYAAALACRHGSAVIDFGHCATAWAGRAEPLMTLSEAGDRALSLPFVLTCKFSDSELAAPSRLAARQRIGLASHDVLLASFDGLQACRAPIDCLWALDLLRMWGFDARLHMLGPALMDVGPLERLSAELGLARWLSWGSDLEGEQAYRDHLIGADVGLQLQLDENTFSLRLGDCLAAGLPSVISASAARDVDAPTYVSTVPDRPSPVLIAEAAASLIGRRPADRTRRAYADAHGMDRHVDAICAALNLPCRSTSI